MIFKHYKQKIENKLKARQYIQKGFEEKKDKNLRTSQVLFNLMEMYLFLHDLNSFFCSIRVFSFKVEWILAINI
jgi:hypothetical protein